MTILSIFFVFLAFHYGNLVRIEDSTSNEKKSYENFKVIEIGGLLDVGSEDELYSQLNLGFSESDFEILHENAINGTVQMLVSPEGFPNITEKLNNSSIGYEVIIEDLERLIRSTEMFRSEPAQLEGEATFARYMNLNEINSYIDSLPATHPRTAKVSTIGHTYEGNEIKMVIITDSISGASARADKPIIFIEAGIHAREWVSVSTATYFMEKLLSNSILTKDLEWRIVPVANPDGYKFTWTKDRMWRKNRRLNGYSHCYGVDLNRNFGAFWGIKGISRHPCSNVYTGKRAFSEKESIAIRDAVLKEKNRIIAYISIHSYGQYILHPPGIKTNSIKLKTINRLEKIASIMEKNIGRQTNTKYTSGAPHDILYSASGLSMDWAFKDAGTPFACTFEMRDKGKRGFLLPPEQIIPAGQDFIAAMTALHDTFQTNPNLLKNRANVKRPSNTAVYTFNEIRSELIWGDNSTNRFDAFDFQSVPEYQITEKPTSFAVPKAVDKSVDLSFESHYPQTRFRSEEAIAAIFSGVPETNKPSLDTSIEESPFFSEEGTSSFEEGKHESSEEGSIERI